MESMQVEVDFKPRTSRALALMTAESSYGAYENESYSSEQHTEEIVKRADRFLGFLEG